MRSRPFVAVVVGGAMAIAGCSSTVAGSNELGPVGDVTAVTTATSATITAILAEPVATSGAAPDTVGSPAPAESQPTTTTESGSPSQPVETATAPQPVDIRLPPKDTRDAITVWLMPQTPERVIQEANKEFAKEYPKVDVNVVRQDWATIDQQLQAKLPAADQTPDVFELATDDAPTLTGQGLLADLSSVRRELRQSDWTPGLTGVTEVDGALTSVPMSGAGRVVAYDAGAWRASGVKEVPRSMAELTEALQRVQAGGVGQDYSAFWFPGRYWQGMLPWIWAERGELAEQTDGSWRGAVDSAESQAGLLAVQDLVERFSKAPTDADQTTANQVRAFDESRASAALMMPWEVQALTKEAKVFALPGMERDTIAPQLLEGSNLAVSAASLRQGLAVAWLRAFLADGVQQEFAQQTQLIPALDSAVAELKGSPLAEVQAQLAKNGRFTPPVPQWAQVQSEQVLPDMLERIVSPVESPSASGSDSSAIPSGSPSGGSIPPVPQPTGSVAASLVPTAPIDPAATAGLPSGIPGEELPTDAAP